MALEFDRSLKFDPQTQVREIALPNLLERGKRLAAQGKIDQAIAQFEKALEFDLSLNFDPQIDPQTVA